MDAKIILLWVITITLLLIAILGIIFSITTLMEKGNEGSTIFALVFAVVLFILTIRIIYLLSHPAYFLQTQGNETVPVRN